MTNTSREDFVFPTSLSQSPKWATLQKVAYEGEQQPFHSRQLALVSEADEKKMLKHLGRFEKGHKRKFERELRRLTRKTS